MEIARGAEAVLTRRGDTLTKERTQKNYRIAVLDKRLRTERTKAEARLLAEAKRAGVSTPRVIEVGNTTLTMEFIEGLRLRDVLNGFTEEERGKLANEIGRNIGRLHRVGIIHGDLTTSNIILRDGELVFIDFGLGYHSTSVEDRAVDLYLLHNALKSTHFQHMRQLWKAVKEGYANEFSDSEETFERFEKIERRGRYAVRVG